MGPSQRAVIAALRALSSSPSCADFLPLALGLGPLLPQKLLAVGIPLAASELLRSGPATAYAYHSPMAQHAQPVASLELTLGEVRPGASGPGPRILLAPILRCWLQCLLG